MTGSVVSRAISLLVVVCFRTLAVEPPTRPGNTVRILSTQADADWAAAQRPALLLFASSIDTAASNEMAMVRAHAAAAGTSSGGSIFYGASASPAIAKAFGVKRRPCALLFVPGQKQAHVHRKFPPKSSGNKPSALAVDIGTARLTAFIQRHVDGEDANAEPGARQLGTAGASTAEVEAEVEAEVSAAGVVGSAREAWLLGGVGSAGGDEGAPLSSPCTVTCSAHRFRPCWPAQLQAQVCN